jgi:hypothetical protein
MIPAVHNITCYIGTTLGPLVFTGSDSDSVAVDITGWTPYAEVRKRSGSEVVLDLAPTITSGPLCKITVEITDEDTAELEAGTYKWDLLLQKPTGERLGPFITGAFILKTKISESDE